MSYTVYYSDPEVTIKAGFEKSSGFRAPSMHVLGTTGWQVDAALTEGWESGTQKPHD